MTMTTTTLRPGLLVSLQTSITGNVTYDKKDLAPPEAQGSEAKARWETVRTITDPAEHERATQARQQARNLITNVCTRSAFGLLCPEADSEKLDKAVAAARAVAEEFNSSAALSRVYVYVISGRIASDDVEAVRAINSEVRELLADMETGTRNLDVKLIRDAAARAKSLGNMLSPDAAARIQIAIDAARSNATRIVKAGQQAAQEIDLTVIRKITEARTAFLDLDGENKTVAVPTEQARAIDLAPAPVMDAPAASVARPILEF